MTTPAHPVLMTMAGETHRLEIVRRRPNLVLRIDGRLHEIETIGPPHDGPATLVIDGERVTVARYARDGATAVRFDGRTFDIGIADPRADADHTGSALDAIQAPMPGAVVSVHKAVGEAVRRGETIITIESMKLQTALPAPRDGVIEQISKREGEMFEKDEVVARLVPLAAEG